MGDGESGSVLKTAMGVLLGLTLFFIVLPTMLFCGSCIGCAGIANVGAELEEQFEREEAQRKAAEAQAAGDAAEEGAGDAKETEDGAGTE